jgi:hypothetical protein
MALHCFFNTGGQGVAMRNFAAALAAGPVKLWRGGAAPDVAGAAAELVLPEAAPREPAVSRRELYQRVVESLWGPDCAMPGGGDELVRLAAVLGPSSATTILLVEAGEGAPARRLATEFGAWVAGVEADPALVAMAQKRAERAGAAIKRASVDAWDPEKPEFRAGFHHHAIALEPLALAEPAPFASALSKAMKPYGHLVMLELLTGELPIEGASLAQWMAAEGRRQAPQTEQHVARCLGRAGFDVRVADDVSDRHRRQCLLGWRGALRLMADRKPSSALAGAFVAEAERWLRRVRLIEEGRLRMVRWHAIGGAGPRELPAD